MLSGTPAALPSRHPRHARPSALGPFAPRMIVQRVLPQRRELLCKLLPPGRRECGGDPDMVKPPRRAIEPEQERADELVGPVLVPPESRHDTVGGACML